MSRSDYNMTSDRAVVIDWARRAQQYLVAKYALDGATVDWIGERLGVAECDILADWQTVVTELCLHIDIETLMIEDLQIPDPIRNEFDRCLTFIVDQRDRALMAQRLAQQTVEDDASE